MIGRRGCGGKGNREGAGGKHKGSENERFYDFVNSLIFQKKWFLWESGKCQKCTKIQHIEVKNKIMYSPRTINVELYVTKVSVKWWLFTYFNLIQRTGKISLVGLCYCLEFITMIVDLFGFEIKNCPHLGSADEDAHCSYCYAKSTGWHALKQQRPNIYLEPGESLC